MESLKLTKKEKEIFDALTSYEGSYLYKHVKPTGLVCYRLLDKERNPIANFQEAKVQNLIDKDVLKIDDCGVVTKATNEKKPLKIK